MHFLADAEFWVAVAFVIFIGVLIKAGAHRLIIDGLDGRAARIKTELDEAKRVRDEAQALLAEYQRKRGEADHCRGARPHQCARRKGNTSAPAFPSSTAAMRADTRSAAATSAESGMCA